MERVYALSYDTVCVCVCKRRESSVAAVRRAKYKNVVETHDQAREGARDTPNGSANTCNTPPIELQEQFDIVSQVPSTSRL